MIISKKFETCENWKKANNYSQCEQHLLEEMKEMELIDNVDFLSLYHLSFQTPSAIT